ncbi:Hypothetical protein R9X50_00652100 [Acrodontium crateriforme]|uniref:Sodium/calcium exchanger membrane region domain-containing protein n=1 Tax=Acrodontium crateriforme TaxID=150365 RepID=A0AAQ3MB43_9PEZI|nr:Hypothetical protein R9X50_00652100 [Acrodontium crateriforme]
MANADIVAFNIAAFIAALFLLEAGADKFIDHTAIVARRIGVSQAIVGLLTAGAEWEELVVVVASLSRNRSSLAVGNVIGSAISNLLGAFSIGLLTHRQGIEFDFSARVYSCLLLVVTTLVAPVTAFPGRILWVVSGSVLLVGFALYLISVAWAIHRGRISAPEGSDSESDDGSSDDDDDDDEVGNRSHDASPLLAPEASTPQRHSRALGFHIIWLGCGLLAICLAGYVLSHAATSLTGQFGLSDVVFGIIVLSLATTLPEKLIAAMSGYRGHSGILVANSVGSNIFLLTLCMGIVMVQTKGDFNAGTVNVVELWVLWGATVGFTFTVFFGAKWSRYIGGLMLVAYMAFIVLEFTIIHHA